MKRIICAVICLFVFTGSISALVNVNTDDTTIELTVVVRGFRRLKGQVFLAIYNSAKSWTKEELVYEGAVIEIIDETATFFFPELPVGLYAIALFHDENKNVKLDTGLFGIPLERYAFSNNRRGLFGPPRFKDAAILLNGNEKIEIICR